MLIEIDNDLFNKVKQIVKDRNSSIFEQLEPITPLEAVTTDNTLHEARAIKTQRVKQSIQETIKRLYSQDIKPTKYQIHKRTNIAYATLSKYYDDILKGVEK